MKKDGLTLLPPWTGGSQNREVPLFYSIVKIQLTTTYDTVSQSPACLITHDTWLAPLLMLLLPTCGNSTIVETCRFARHLQFLVSACGWRFIWPYQASAYSQFRCVPALFLMDAFVYLFTFFVWRYLSVPSSILCVCVNARLSFSPS